MLTDLKKFLMRGNVVDLAVAVVIGVAFQAVVNAFVEFIVNPLIAWIAGEPDISDVLTFTLREETATDPATILSIGGFLQSVLDFVIIGTALFVVVRAYESLQARRTGEDEADEEPTDEIRLLTEIRDSLRSGTR